MAAQMTFQRVEKKYLLTPAQLAALWPQLMDYMQVDRYGKHTINNIYYDTPDFALIRNSLQKPLYKEKLRLRSYGTPTAEDTVFVELKKKYKGIVYKRRESMPLRLAEIYLATGAYPAAQSQSLPRSQIMKEIDYFMQMYRPHPAVCLAYDRVALFGRPCAGQQAGQGELRLTIDSDIRYRTENMHLDAGSAGQLLPATEGLYLMEVKLPGAMPLWMCHALAELEIWPVSFSKYGSCYQTCLAPALQNQMQNELQHQMQNNTTDKNGGMTCA